MNRFRRPLERAYFPLTMDGETALARPPRAGAALNPGAAFLPAGIR